MTDAEKESICQKRAAKFITALISPDSIPTLFWSTSSSFWQRSAAFFNVTNYVAPESPDGQTATFKKRLVYHSGNSSIAITEPVRLLLVRLNNIVPGDFNTRLVSLFNGYLRIDATFTRSEFPELPDELWPCGWNSADDTLAPCLTASVTLNIYPDRFTYPSISPLGPRRARIYGQKDSARWRKFHAEWKLGRKFTRQTDKLVENPNDKGFGNDGTKDWKDGIRDAAKRVAVDAAKSAVASATKGITDRAAKKVGTAIKKRATNALKEILRKR